jgi:ubiquinone/menaquinone biosynthesis C-methylase UbiE
MSVMPRVLEPEAMDEEAAARTYDRMDHRLANDNFVADLVAAGWVPDDTLDLGTGTAQIPVQLARAFPECRIMALDLAIPMLDLARYRLEAAGVTRQVQLVQGDAKQLGFPDSSFRQVISNSIVHHLPTPELGLAEAVRVTAPGGLLFFRDLMRPATAEAAADLVTRHMSKETPEAQQLFLESLHAALTLSEMRSLVANLGFPEESVQATSDRHWTWTARKPKAVSAESGAKAGDL